MNIVPVLAGKLMRIKVLWHLNDTSAPRFVKEKIIRFVLFLSDRIAVTSSKVKEYYLENIPDCSDSVVTFHIPVDTSQFNPNKVDKSKVIEIKKKLGIPLGCYVIGTVGNINRTKGYNYFFEAARLIKKEISNVIFLVVGGKINTQVAYFDKLIRYVRELGIDNEVIFTGFQENVQEMLSVMDTFVLPSVAESGPLVLLEAMAMKLPVVATDVGLVSEVVIPGESGIIVKPRDVNGIASGVCSIYKCSREKREALGEAGRERVRNLFSLDRIVCKHIEVYNSMGLHRRSIGV